MISKGCKAENAITALLLGLQSLGQLQKGLCGGGPNEEGYFEAHTLVSGPNLDHQKTADFPATSALCLFRVDVRLRQLETKAEKRKSRWKYKLLESNHSRLLHGC